MKKYKISKGTGIVRSTGEPDFEQVITKKDVVYTEDELRSDDAHSYTFWLPTNQLWRYIRVAKASVVITNEEI